MKVLSVLILTLLVLAVEAGKTQVNPTLTYQTNIYNPNIIYLTGQNYTPDKLVRFVVDQPSLATYTNSAYANVFGNVYVTLIVSGSGAVTSYIQESKTRWVLKKAPFLSASN